MSSLTYTQNGDYLIPNLVLDPAPSKPLGKYGRMRKAYLKEHRPLIYNQLLMSEKLYLHLLEIDETANSRLEQMMPPAGEGSRSGRGAESPRPDEMGGPDEHLQGAGRGNPDGGTHQQLSFFLTEAEQIEQIDRRAETEKVSAFSFSGEDIALAMASGSGLTRAKSGLLLILRKTTPPKNGLSSSKRNTASVVRAGLSWMAATFSGIQCPRQSSCAPIPRDRNSGFPGLMRQRDRGSDCCW